MHNAEDRLLSWSAEGLSAFKIDLKNKSIVFINAFNLAFSRVLQRKPVRVAGPNRDGHYEIQYCSKAFVSWWLRQGLFDFRAIMQAFPVEYLRGRYDSDCNVHGSTVDLVGVESHRTQMELERTLCIGLGMRTGKIHLYGKTGGITYTRSKRIVSKEQRIRFGVNSRDFLRCVKRLNVEWRDDKLRNSHKGRAWTSWQPSVKERALTLRRDHNWTCKKIANKLEQELGQRIPYETVYSWLKRNQRPT